MMQKHHVILITLTCCWKFEASDRFPGNSPYHLVDNANHIFNTIHSSLRQWGSSLNHNGMSVFPAIVPQGTMLYHGTSKQDAVTGLEWVSFERDHALNFAHLYLAPSPTPPERDSKAFERFQRGRNPSKNYDRVLQAQQSRNEDPIWILPGYLHTYSARRDLRLIYLDGSSAATCNKGTLDVSDLVLLNDSQLRTTAETERAHRLCQIATTDWDGQVDGFIRMEAGFEIIMCSFADSLHFNEALRVEEVDNGGTTGTPADIFYWLRAAAARYDGVGGSPRRILVNYDEFLTAYAYPVDLFQGNASLPRLTGAPKSVLEEMRNAVTSMVLRPGTFEIDQRSCNWQAVADMIVQKYACPLQQLVTSRSFENSSAQVAQELNYMLRPYIDTLHRDAELETKRCAAEFMPANLRPSEVPSNTSSLSERAIYGVSHHICSALVNILWSLSSPFFSDDRAFQQLDSLRDLTAWLGWTEWKKCKGCSWDEICAIPMFPFGVVEDHKRPRCRGVDSLSWYVGYWDDT